MFYNHKYTIIKNNNPMGKGIEHFILEEFNINEAVLKEVSFEKVLKALKKFGFEKNKDFKIKGKSVYLNSEKVAEDVADEMIGDYEVTYDDLDDFKLTLFQ